LEERWREKGRGEGEEIEGDEEDFVEATEDEEDSLIRVIQVQNPASRFIDLLVTGIPSSHNKGRIHVNIMTSQIQRDESLKEESPPRPGRRKEDE